MDTAEDLEAYVDFIASTEGKFNANAYVFVIAGVGNYVATKFKGNYESILYQKLDYNELLQWLKMYGFYRYGMLAKFVFNKWGIKKSNEFLDIIVTLVSYNLINKNYISEAPSKKKVKTFDFSDYEKDYLFAAYSEL